MSHDKYPTEEPGGGDVRTALRERGLAHRPPPNLRRRRRLLARPRNARPTDRVRFGVRHARHAGRRQRREGGRLSPTSSRFATTRSTKRRSRGSTSSSTTTGTRRRDEHRTDPEDRPQTRRGGATSTRRRSKSRGTPSRPTRSRTATSRGPVPYCGAHARGDECDEGCRSAPRTRRNRGPDEHPHRQPGRVPRTDAQVLPRFGPAGVPAGVYRPPRRDEQREEPAPRVDRGRTAGLVYLPRYGLGHRLPREDEGTEDLVLYVWVDAPIEYIASTKQYTERVGADTYDWEETWKESGEIVHIIGRDIIQHHTVFWPAMLNVAEYNEPAPSWRAGSSTSNGKGFSTSRNRAVWADDYLDEGFHPDLLRYYLATNGGFQQDVDFSWERFQERVNWRTRRHCRQLRLPERCCSRPGTTTARRTPTLSDEVASESSEAIDEFGAAVNDYSLKDLGDAADALAAFGNEYIQRNEPWKLDRRGPGAGRTGHLRLRPVRRRRSPSCSNRSCPARPKPSGRNSARTGSVHDAGRRRRARSTPRRLRRTGRVVRQNRGRARRGTERKARRAYRSGYVGRRRTADGRRIRE